MIHKLELKGFGHVELWREGECIHSSDFVNGITNIGKNTLLNTMFNGLTQAPSWWIGLIGNTSYSSTNAGDTIVSHTGWHEYTDFSGSTRQQWNSGPASGQQIVNGSAIEVTLISPDTLQGVFITTGATKGNTTDGVLWSTALFPTPLACQGGDILRLTYAIQL